MCCRQFSLNLEVELDNDPGTFGGLATNRKCTDVFGLIIMVLFFGAVIGLSAYCISNSEVEKILNGYDDCGNICGKNNIKIDSMPSGCTAKNMEQKKYVFIKEDAAFGRTKECVENCTMQGTFLLNNYCSTDVNFIPFLIKMDKLVKLCVPICVMIAILTVCINLNENMQCKNDKRIMKYFSLAIQICWLIYLCVGSYIAYLENINLFIVFVTISAIMTIAIVLYLPSLFSQQISMEQDLVVQLYEEVFEVMNVKIFCLLPILSFIVLTGSAIGVFYCCLWLQSFSYPDQIYIENESRLNYVQYPIATVTMVLVIYALCLLHEFLKNCQCMIVGGYVAQRYFAGSDGVPDPIKRSLTNLLKYHLGSVCCGSLLLPIIYALRAFANGIKGAARGYNAETVCTCSCRLMSLTCLGTDQACLWFFSQNSFIMTAVKGCTFCAGTIRAHKLFSHNTFNVASINSLGDLYLEVLKLYCWVITNMLCIIIRRLIMDQVHLPITFIIFTFIFSYILADFLVSVLRVTKDTLFLCFCEDYLYNNGTSKPYKMSTKFAQFIENANKFVNSVKWKDVADKWEKGPRRLY